MADELEGTENSLRKGPKVAVIGAGISGLTAASSLVQEGFDVILVEASDYIGGRIKQAEPFPGFPPVDMGADFIHGSTSIINRLAEENKWNIKTSHGIDNEDPKTVTVFLDGKHYSCHDTNQPDIFAATKAWHELMMLGDKLNLAYTDNIIDKNDTGILHRDLFSWLASKGLSQKAVDIIDCKYCQTNGGALGINGVLECAHDETCWQYGGGNHRLDGSYSVLISHYLEKCTKVDKRLNWPVKEIKWIDKQDTEYKSWPPSVVMTSEHGESLTVDYAVVTVPLTILKDGDIIFSPPLPPTKQHAINTIHMGAALKIVCRFKTPFWKEKTVIFTVRGFLSQIWTYSRDPKEDGEECHVAVGFETAVRAAQKVHLSDQVVCEKFLQQLDELFGNKEDPNPASNNFMNFAYEHWSRHPYVRGGYSTQTANAHGLRQHLAEPVGGRLFFAGEATHLKAVATVQAAIETGMRAACEVCGAANLQCKTEKDNIY